MFKIDIGKVVGSLKPYGPTPIVAVAIGIAAEGALAASIAIPEAVRRAPRTP